MYVYIYIYIYIYILRGHERRLLQPRHCVHGAHPHPGHHDAAHAVLGRGGRCGWKPSSSSNLSIRGFRAFSLVEI